MSNKFSIFLVAVVMLAGGYLLGTYLPFTKTMDTTVSVSDTVQDDTKTEGQSLKEESSQNLLGSISVNGKECALGGKYENPYKKGEFLYMTSRFCANPNSESSLLLQEGSGPYKDLLSDRTKYSYPYDNVYQANNDTVMFLNADEIVYVSADGEGSECGGGGSSFYNKFNLRTGAVETVAKGGSGYHCHDFTVANNESDYTNACYDGGETYAYKDVNLKFSVLCSDRLKTGSRTLTVTFNDKVVLTKTVPDSMDKPWSFLGTMNTVFLLLGKGHDLGFQAAGGYYSIDTATGRLVSTVG